MEILRAGMQAPSACNQQPWEFYVVTDLSLIHILIVYTKFQGIQKSGFAMISTADDQGNALWNSHSDNFSLMRKIHSYTAVSYTHLVYLH